MVGTITSSVKKKTRAEKILEDIEVHLKKLISEKRELKKNFLTKLKELENQEKENKEWFENNWSESERIENKLILLWDYWQREVEISHLEKKIGAGVLPSEREEIMSQIRELNKRNITLEQGFKKRKIDAEVIKGLRKRLGVWEEK